MTAKKDIEKLEVMINNNRNVLWILIAVILIMAAGLIVHSSHPNPSFTEANPCELGWMEWEYKPITQCEVYCIETGLGWSDTNCTVAERNCNIIMGEKSCPYDGPPIMVVKE